MRAARPARPPLVLLIAGYLAAAVFYTWPLPLELTSRLGAPEGPGDPYLNLWILGWDLRTLAADPGALFTGRLFDANIFHPAASTLAYSDHLIPQALVLLPVYVLTGDVVLCYNLLLLASIAASGLAMHALARTLSGSESGAWVAGLAWAWLPYRASHLIHLQLQSLYFLPLALLFLHRVVARGRTRDVLLLGLTAGLQAASSIYYGVFTALALAVAAIVLAVGVGRWRRPALWRRLAGAALVGLVVVAPFVWPYWQAQQREGFARNLFEASRHAAVPLSYLQVAPENVLYGRTGLLRAVDDQGAPRPGRVEGVEHGLFPGLTIVVLAVIGAWRWRRASRPVAAALLAIGALAFTLSLGPDGLRPLYAAAHRLVFGFQAIRAPARFGVLVAFALAVLAAGGVAAIGRGLPRRERLAGLIAAVLVAVESFSGPLPLVPRPPRETPVGQWLAREPGAGVVVHLPLTNDRENTRAMVTSLEHGRPLVNGYSGQRPSFFPAVVDAMSTFPGAEALWTLRDLDVRFVVSHGRLPAAGGPTPLVERAVLGDAAIYELRWTAEIEEAVVRPAPTPPPPPGEVPFGPGEVAVYDVGWSGGGLGVSAGRATVRADHLDGPAAWRFTATAESAPWVARFFEASDTFQTDADAALLPLRHVRAIREGRRRLDRLYAFDDTEGTVRVTTPEEEQRGVVLRVPPATRDALTAFYYVRTLPLTPGSRVALPVSDGGRTRIVTVDVRGRETVEWQERETPAIRIDPVIAERVPRRTPPRVSVWLSDDARRIPLRAEVEGPFGRLQLRLVDYLAGDAPGAGAPNAAPRLPR